MRVHMQWSHAHGRCCSKPVAPSMRALNSKPPPCRVLMDNTALHIGGVRGACSLAGPFRSCMVSLAVGTISDRDPPLTCASCLCCVCVRDGSCGWMLPATGLALRWAAIFDFPPLQQSQLKRSLCSFSAVRVLVYRW
jgi:hypothetical protein